MKEQEQYRIVEALTLFVHKEVSFARAAELSGISLNDFINVLKEKNISWAEYTEEDF